MQIHELKPKHKSKKGKTIGRGGKKGTYSGKGIKGQTSRAGRKLKPGIRELIKRYPKLRGYKFKSFAKETVILDLSILEKNFESGEVVNPKKLVEKGIIDKIKGRVPQCKILGDGEIKKALTIEGCKLSESAKEKIKKAGGKAETEETKVVEEKKPKT